MIVPDSKSRYQAFNSLQTLYSDIIVLCSVDLICFQTFNVIFFQYYFKKPQTCVCPVLKRNITRSTRAIPSLIGPGQCVNYQDRKIESTPVSRHMALMIIHTIPITIYLRLFLNSEAFASEFQDSIFKEWSCIHLCLLPGLTSALWTFQMRKHFRGYFWRPAWVISSLVLSFQQVKTNQSG